jgi:hypothetical protein
MNCLKTGRILISFALILLSFAASGEEESDTAIRIGIGTTAYMLATGADEAEAAGVIAFDAAVAIPLVSGEFSLLIEAENSDDLFNPASDYLRADQYQARLSELHYDFTGERGEWAIGIIDSKTYLDVSAVANDDKSQFSNPVFVNNPTVKLETGRPGMAWGASCGSGQCGYAVVLAAGDDKGAFLGLESRWNLGAMVARLGAWGDNGEAQRPAEQSRHIRDFGFYAAIDGRLGVVDWNVRAGLAHTGSRSRQSFLGLAAAVPLRSNTIGIAVGHSVHRGKTAPEASYRAAHFEIYYRYTVSEQLAVTPGIQYGNGAGPLGGPGALTASVRLRLVI